LQLRREARIDAWRWRRPTLARGIILPSLGILIDPAGTFPKTHRLQVDYRKQERPMRNIILAAMCATAIGAVSVGTASAQSTGPSGQDSTKMGTESTMSKDGTKSGTQGMSKDSMSKSSMHKDSMKKDSMKKDEMKK
jgi:pentapeptide MXKDX repeat protein